jgi:hypothetical protein
MLEPIGSIEMKKVQEKSLKSAVWLFRSATNVRKIADWNRIVSLDQTTPIPEEGRIIFSDHELMACEIDLKSTLEQKAQFAGLWRIICPLVNEYSLSKLDHLRDKLIETE